MSSDRSYACVAWAMLFVFGVGNAAEFECPLEPPRLPHETWEDIQSASADELYRRVRGGLSHWSRKLELQLAIRDSLAQLLIREPYEGRGYVELARFVMIHGSLDTYTLTEDAYDIAGQALQTALELDPESAVGWALEGNFRDLRRGWAGRFGNGQSPLEALETADLYGPLEPQVMFAWAQWHAFRAEYVEAVERMKRLLAADDPSEIVAALAHRKLADYYAKLNRPDEAIRAAERAIEIQPDDPNNWLTLSALVLEHKGDAEQALATARTAFCIDASSAANLRIAYALYVDWAQEYTGSEQPTMGDERVIEAFERHPDVANVMGYLSAYQPLSSLVEVFVRAGLSLDAEEGSLDGLNLLYEAVRQGSLADAERLIDLGADVNRSGDPYGSFLSEAVINRDEAMVRLLIEHGADVNAQQPPQGTALIASIIVGDADIVALLLNAGADPGLVNHNGETPLQLAVLAWDDPAQRRRLVELLLAAGADPDVEIIPGLSIVDHAVQQGFTDVTDLLAQASRVAETPGSPD